MPSAVIFGTDHQTPTLLGPLENRLNNVNELLLVLQDPVELVVVASTEIAHDVLVAEEEHYCARIVQFVHGVEVGNLFVKSVFLLVSGSSHEREAYLVDVADVYGSEVLDPVCDFEENLILEHAVL